MRVRPTAPSLGRHLSLLWGLRILLGLNRSGRTGRIGALVVYLLSAAPGIPAFLVCFRLLRLPWVMESLPWTAFLLNLLCFVTFCVWCAWPVLSAGVDDHSEASRYRAFPVSPFRLLLASTLASLAEPRALVFVSPLLGAALAVVWDAPKELWLGAVILFALFSVLAAAWGRAGAHLILNVLKAPNSAQILGGGFFVFLFVCAFIPPVDVSWLTRPEGGGLGALNVNVVENAALALGRVPPGFLGMGLLRLRSGNLAGVLRYALGLLSFAALGVGAAYYLLLQFYRGVGRGVPSSTRRGSKNFFGRVKTRFGALLAREALDLWNNPRARLLVSVPFVLGIFMKILSTRALFVYALGTRADAWLMGGLALYGAVVMGSTFSQNAFAYDGYAMAVFLCAPLKLAEVLRAKNLVHAAAALGLGTLAVVFYRLYFGHGSVWDVLLSLMSIVALVPVLLVAGNFLSMLFPVKFHANLQRRDRLPLLASMLGIGAASLGCAPFAWAVRHAGQGLGAAQLGVVALFGLGAWALYLGLFPLAVRGLEARREAVFQGVTRE